MYLDLRFQWINEILTPFFTGPRASSTRWLNVTKVNELKWSERIETQEIWHLGGIVNGFLIFYKLSEYRWDSQRGLTIFRLRGFDLVGNLKSFQRNTAFESVRWILVVENRQDHPIRGSSTDYFFHIRIVSFEQLNIKMLLQLKMNFIRFCHVWFQSSKIWTSLRKM